MKDVCFKKNSPLPTFVLGAIESLFSAFPIVPSIGKARPRVIARLRPRNIDTRCCDRSQPTLSRISRIRDSVSSGARALPTRDGRRHDDGTHLVSARGVEIEGVGSA